MADAFKLQKEMSRAEDALYEALDAFIDAGSNYYLSVNDNAYEVVENMGLKVGKAIWSSSSALPGDSRADFYRGLERGF